MEFTNKLLYEGKMDGDSDPSFVKDGQYVYALNLRPYNAVDGAIGVGHGIEGCVNVRYDFGESARFLYCVGSKLDTVRNRIYWFVVSRLKAYILCYEYKTKRIFPIFNYTNILDFSINTHIVNIDIVYDNEFGDTLFWVGKGEPRKINVKAGENRFNNFKSSPPYLKGDFAFAGYNNAFQNATVSLPFTASKDTSNPISYDFSTGDYNSADWLMRSVSECYPPTLFATMFYQKPITPYFSPNATYRYDNNVVTPVTKILENSYQFSYKYVYFDGQESEWSPKSEAVFPNILTSLMFDEAEKLVDVSYDNISHISVRVPVNITRSSNSIDLTEQPHAMISRIKIALREVPRKDAPGDWYELANIPIEDFYKYDLSPSAVSSGFPQSGTAGTFYYNWDSLSYLKSSVPSRVVTITYDYDGTTTLIPIDPLDAHTLYYNVPREARAQELAVNRMVWGGRYKDNMRIAKPHYNSMENNISLNLANEIKSFNVSFKETELSSFTQFEPPWIFTDIDGVHKILHLGFNMTKPFNINDYTQTFEYNFTIGSSIFVDTGTPPYTLVGLVLSVSGIVHDGIYASGYASMGEFLDAIFQEAFIPYLGYEMTLVTEFHEEISMFGLSIYLTNPAHSYHTVFYYSTSSNPYTFYLRADSDPVRTFKNHSRQQLGFVLQDDAGRLTSVITGDWAKIDVGHFINNDKAVSSKIRINNLSSITVPQEARVMHVVRKRSGSYSDFLQFSLSKGNCEPFSWNNFTPYYIGFLDLSLDEFTTDSFLSYPKNLYISLNSITGGIGGAYDVLRDRAQSSAGNRTDSRAPRSPGTPQNPEIPRQPITGNRGGVVTPPVPRSQRKLYEPMAEQLAIRYVPTDGDVVRFLYRVRSNGQIETYSHTFPIVSYDAKWNTIVLDWNEVEKKEPALALYLQTHNSYSNPPDVTILAEIIRIPTQSDNEFFWECAAQLSCRNGRVLIGQGGHIDIFGDVYMKVRGNSINYKPLQMKTQNFVVQDMNFNDFYPSANSGEGRPNIVVGNIRSSADYINEISRPNIITHSEKSVQSTDIRRYGTVYDANIQEVDSSFGGIEHIESEGDKITIYQEDRIAYAFLERSMTQELSGSERVISSQNQIISDVVYYPYQGGLSRDGGSFAKAGYRSYFADSKRGAVYRQSMDGINAISDYGMSGEFKRLFASMNNSRIPTTLRGVVNDVYDEYILHAVYSQAINSKVVESTPGALTIEVPTVFPDGARSYYGNHSAAYLSFDFVEFVQLSVTSQTANTITLAYPEEVIVGTFVAIEILSIKTLVFSERSKGWAFFLGYSSEWSERGINGYNTFLQGQLWVHDVNNKNYNNFHGKPQDSELVLSDGSQATDRWLTVGVKTNIKPDVPSVKTSMEMESSIPKDLFEYREGTYWAHYLRNSKSAGGLYEGDYLKGRWNLTKFRWKAVDIASKQLKVFGAAFNKDKSQFTI